MYNETKAPLKGVPTSTWASVRDITLTGQAKWIDITVITKNVYVRLGNGSAAVTTGNSFYLPKDKAAFRMWPKPGETRLGLLGSSTAAASVFVQEVI